MAPAKIERYRKYTNLEKKEPSQMKNSAARKLKQAPKGSNFGRLYRMAETIGYSFTLPEFSLIPSSKIGNPLCLSGLKNSEIVRLHRLIKTKNC